MDKFLNFSPDTEIESPGRINLIGEHIDYNGGFVLPAAIDKVIHFKFKKRKDNFIHIESTFKIKICKLADIIKNFKNRNFKSLNEIERKLFVTYLSHKNRLS